MKYTTQKGSVFTLEFDGLYRWKRSEGALPANLKQAFVFKGDAINAVMHYDHNIEKEGYKDESTSLEKLDVLTKGDELRAFAKTHGIEVPAGLTKPMQMKKMIKAELEKQSA